MSHCSKEKLTQETPILFPNSNMTQQQQPQQEVKLPIGSVSGNPDQEEPPKPGKE
jgi:hypothetical protein